MTFRSIAVTVSVVATAARLVAGPGQKETGLPTGPLAFGAFVLEISADGDFRLEGQGWPALFGVWKVSGTELVLQSIKATGECPGPGRYGFKVKDGRLHLQLVSDECTPRHMILDGSTWRPAGEAETIAERRIVLTAAEARGPRPESTSDTGCWPSFRGPAASGVADGQNLPDEWNGETGKNILLEDADSRSRSLEPDCLGRPPVCDQRRQQPRRCELSARFVR